MKSKMKTMDTKLNNLETIIFAIAKKLNIPVDTKSSNEKK